MSFLSPLAFINLLWLQVSPETLLYRTRTGFVLDLAYWLHYKSIYIKFFQDLRIYSAANYVISGQSREIGDLLDQQVM